MVNIPTKVFVFSLLDILQTAMVRYSRVI